MASKRTAPKYEAVDFSAADFMSEHNALMAEIAHQAALNAEQNATAAAQQEYAKNHPSGDPVPQHLRTR